LIAPWGATEVMFLSLPMQCHALEEME
jgi:hypothetical protein